MTSYYHKLLEQRHRWQRNVSWRKKLIYLLTIVLILAFATGFYFFFLRKDKVSLELGKATVSIQIAESLRPELAPKVEKFAQENKGLNIDCQDNCARPDILFDVQKNPGYAHAEMIGRISSSKSKYVYQAPNKFVLNDLTEIWMMSQSGGKLVDDLTKTLESQYLSSETTVNAVGDIMLSRTVDAKIAEAGNSKLPFLYTFSFLRDADITLGNLESPFFDEGAPVRSGMVFKANPASVSGLKLAGFDIVTLANNHFGNQGQAGMLYTFSLLTKNKIDYIGAGKNLSDASQILVKEVNGVKMAFVGVENYSIAPESSFATATAPGILHVEADRIASLVKKAKNLADIVLVTFHGGTEYQPFANDQQKAFAHAAIDAGADIVIGHHPHVVEGLENYKGKFIIYSLGNFVFDQMWSTETQQGMAAQLTFTGKLITSIKLIPVHIYNFNQPRIADPAERNAIIKRILDNSEL